MKLKTIIILLINFSCSAGFAQSSFTKENLLKDLDAYRDCIAHNHIDPFTKISKKEFYKDIENIKDSAAGMNVDELMIELLKANAKINDEHTGIIQPQSRIFPFRAFWFEEGIFIYSTDTFNSKITGSKIIAINNIDINDIALKLTSILADKNPAAIKKIIPQYLTFPSILYGLKIIDQKDFAWFLIKKENGDTVKYRLEATEPGIKFEIPDNWKLFLRFSKTNNYWYQYDSIGHFIYFNYSRCFNDKKFPFDVFQKELSDEIKSRNPKKLIIDLRANSGGSSVLLDPFIEEMKNSKINEKAKIYVLIGRGTFSSAILNAVDIKNQLGAILVGEETSGSVNHFGEVNFCELTNTKLKVSYSIKHFIRDKNSDGSLKPDIVTPETYVNFEMRIDPALNYATGIKY